MITSDQACAIIDYIEALEERTNHNSIMEKLQNDGYTEKELDEACKALGKIAGRTFSIL